MHHKTIAAICCALTGVSTVSASADVVFTSLIADMGGAPSTITFDEFDLGTQFGPGPAPLPPSPPSGLAVPGHGAVLQGTLPFAVGDFDAFFPGDVQPGFFSGNGMFNPSASIVPQVFQVRFDAPVSAAGLVLYNNFGAVARNYGLRAYGADGGLLAEETVIPVVASPEFLGFKSDVADIAALELRIGITFNTGQRPFFDTITYNAAADTDGDGIADSADSCVEVANADQLDADGDGFGNVCDQDVNNDCVVNAVDLGALKAGFFGADAVLDFNGDGAVNAIDLGLMKQAFFGAPGPSGLTDACGG